MELAPSLPAVDPRQRHEIEVRSVSTDPHWRCEPPKLLSSCVEHPLGKPANTNDRSFARIHDEAIACTEAFADKRVVLCAPTLRAATEIPDGTLDAVYVDGDHTLRGITIDLIRMPPKVRTGGLIGGDDFTKSIWQHGAEYDPTEVFPFAVHFAEAHDLPIVTLPHAQFCIVNAPAHGFEVIDLGGYAGLTPRQIYLPPSPPRRSRFGPGTAARWIPARIKRPLKALLGR